MYTQLPAAHAAEAPARAAQALPQAPQWAALVCVSTSQPSSARRLQSEKPTSHAPTAHDPDTHAGVALATLHAAPHAPQWAASVWVSTQDTPAPVPHSRSGAVHEARQAPATQSCPTEHATPHAPQFARSLWALTSHPVAAL